jgi:hypothetical protein
MSKLGARATFLKRVMAIAALAELSATCIQARARASASVHATHIAAHDLIDLDRSFRVRCG